MGVAPLGQLACGVGARLAYDEGLASFVVEGAPEGVQVERHDAEAVVVVDERERAAVPRDRAHGGRVDDRARIVAQRLGGEVVCTVW